MDATDEDPFDNTVLYRLAVLQLMT